MAPLYRLTDVAQRYGARVVLQIERLHIHQGETLALLGPSGAGKSTLLRLLALLEAPAHGTITYDGQRLDGAPPLALRREIALVFQRPRLLDTSVRRNIAYGLRIRGTRDEARVAAAIELLGLQRVAQARPATLSGGEMQRVALARALVLRPRVLLLDEPTANLDPSNVAIIEQALQELRRESRTTLVIATHNFYQARRLTQRAVILLDGQLVADGPTTAVLQAPTDPRAAAFVNGAMIY